MGGKKKISIVLPGGRDRHEIYQVKGQEETDIFYITLVLFFT